MYLPLMIFYTFLIHLSWRQMGSPFNPIAIQASIWLAAFLYLSLDGRFNAIPIGVQLIFLTASLTFACGVAFFGFFLPNTNQNIVHSSPKEFALSRSTKYIYYLVCIVLFVGFLVFFDAYKGLISTNSSLADYIAVARRNSLHGLGVVHDIPIIKQVPLFLNILCAFLLVQYLHNRDKGLAKLLVIAIVISLIAGMVEGSRSLFFRFFVSFVMIMVLVRSMKSQKIPIMRLITLIIALVILFSSVGALREGDNFSTYFTNLGWILQIPAKYLFGSLVLFGERFPEMHTVYSGPFTTGWMPEYLTKENHDLVISYTAYGHPELGYGNTYTFLGPLVNDYGIIGTLAIIFILGVISAYFYSYRGKSPFHLVTYSLICSSLIFSTYSEYFITMFPIFVRILLVYFLLLKFTQYFERNSNHQSTDKHRFHGTWKD